MESDRIETPTAVIWREDGIIHVQIKADARVELEDAQQHAAAVKRLSHGGLTPLFTDITGVRSTSREARAIYGAGDAVEWVSALALLVGSPISRTIGNFYLGLNRPPYPTRLFTDRQSALAWLRDFLR